MLAEIPTDWRAVLRVALADPAVASLEAFVAGEREKFDVYPSVGEVFTALRLTPFATIRAVILGQDPYQQPRQACGMAFSVSRGTPPPPSLRNILAELEHDLGRPMPADGSLVPWAQHGVPLLNTILTVRRGVAHSHANQGWERLTEAIVTAVATKPVPVAFLLWGTPAQAYRRDIDGTRHVVVASTHPSPAVGQAGLARRPRVHRQRSLPPRQRGARRARSAADRLGPHSALTGPAHAFEPHPKPTRRDLDRSLALAKLLEGRGLRWLHEIGQDLRHPHRDGLLVVEVGRPQPVQLG